MKNVTIKRANRATIGLNKLKLAEVVSRVYSKNTKGTSVQGKKIETEPIIVANKVAKAKKVA